MTDSDVRRIATAWGTSGTALEVLASTGAIEPGLLGEILDSIHLATNEGRDTGLKVARAVKQLLTLYRWVMHHPSRGPQPGWDKIPFERRRLFDVTFGDS